MILNSVDGTELADDFPWGRIAWLCNGNLDEDAEITVGQVVIEPGEKNPRHSHDCDEVLFLYEGELEHSYGDEVHVMKPGDAIRVPKDIPHDARNTGTVPARMVIAYPTPHRGFTAHE